jgi:hypothetical protein
MARGPLSPEQVLDELEFLLPLSTRSSWSICRCAARSVTTRKAAVIASRRVPGPRPGMCLPPDIGTTYPTVGGSLIVASHRGELACSTSR